MVIRNLSEKKSTSRDVHDSTLFMFRYYYYLKLRLIKNDSANSLETVVIVI